MTAVTSKIDAPSHPSFKSLCAKLQELSDQTDSTGNWPAVQLRFCAEFGVYEWFLPRTWQGQQWDDEQIVRGYLNLSSACLTTTFIITQRTGASQRIERSENDLAKQRLLPGLRSGELFATVGISHLTTSRQHLQQPVLRAVRERHGFRLDGFSPWVTGARQANVVVVGATLDDGRQILVASPTDLAGVTVPPPLALMGLAASHTGPLEFENVWISDEWLLAGPVHEVMKQGVGARTGGLQTSTLAIGSAQRPIEFLEQQACQRTDLQPFAEALRRDWEEIRSDLLQAAANRPNCTDAELRTRANSLVLRASQAALAAAKGTGYVNGHPAARWCRESLFFLVWSCPQPVVAANLCEFSGLE